MSRNNSILAVALAAGLLSGCGADYLHRYDTVTLSAGDAVRHNRILHAVDPFNPVSHDTTIRSSGGQTAEAVRRYRTGPQQAAATATSQ